MGRIRSFFIYTDDGFFRLCLVERVACRYKKLARTRRKATLKIQKNALWILPMIHFLFRIVNVQNNTKMMVLLGINLVIGSIFAIIGK